MAEGTPGFDVAERYSRLRRSAGDPPDVVEFLRQWPDADIEAKVAVLLRHQYDRWSAGRPVFAEEYSERFPELAEQPQHCARLVLAEYQLRESHGESVDVEEYEARFPRLTPWLRRELEPGAGQRTTPVAAKSATRSLHESSGSGRGDLMESLMTLSENAGKETEHVRLGRYELHEMIGQGAYGRVFLGYDRDLDRQIAVKVPIAERIRHPKQRRHFLDEARMAASLDHPNIVPVHDVGTTPEGLVFVVAKYIKGCTLHERLRIDPPDHEESARLIARVSGALDHAHRHRLIHRDVKPGNILIETATEQIYLSDFGLAIRE